MRFLLVTLGCAKNEVDSDRMRALLLSAGFEEVDDAAEADVALVNTCSFLASATEESVEATLQIAEERSEYNRLKDLADQQKAAIEEKVEAARRRMENGTAFLTSCLADFFNTVPHKTTKTTEKYRLLSGTLTLKKGTVKATVDDAKLVPWLRENGYGDLVKVEESAKWGELKKLLAYTGEIATIQSTGEIVEGVTAYETPATFTVDI